MSSNEKGKIKDNNHRKVNTTTDINEDDTAVLPQFTPLRLGETMSKSQQDQNIKRCKMLKNLTKNILQGSELFTFDERGVLRRPNAEILDKMFLYLDTREQVGKRHGSLEKACIKESQIVGGHWRRCRKRKQVKNNKV